MKNRLQSTSKYPTSLIIQGANPLGLEIIESLLEQGGYVIIIDTQENYTNEVLSLLEKYELVTVLDFSAINTLEDDLRRLDYVFYLQHKYVNNIDKVSSQEFLQFSNYLDTILDVAVKFESKFLLTTSIRAHQEILKDKHFDVNYNSEVEDTHTIYSESGVQRYAESLTQEYFEKTGLNTRILRLGEILGKGVNIDSGSDLMELIIMGLKNKQLVIKGDGLGTHYFIHTLDTAYGVLKAQFSVNTKGEIFTLANEEEMSLLSVAYKLQEIIEDVEEIVFKEEDDSLPPIKLYKPARHLNSIGWKSRVNIDRALSQTVDFVKNKLSESRSSQKARGKATKKAMKGKKSIKENLKKFIFRAEEKEENDQEQSFDGALAKLIEQRKQQEKARKGSIIRANSLYRNKHKPVKKMSRADRFNNMSYKLFDKLKERFNFLKNITVTDFIFAIIGIVAFSIIFFLLISPLSSLTKNLVYIKYNLDRLETNISGYHFIDGKSNNAVIKDNLISAQERVRNLEFLFVVFSDQSTYEDMQALLTSAIEYSDGLENLLIALEPVDDIVKSFAPGIKYTNSSTNLLMVDSDQDFSAEILRMKNNARLVVIGKNKIINSEQELNEKFQLLPDWLKNIFDAQLGNILENSESFNTVNEIYEYLPGLLGDEKPTNYLILIQDNSRYTAGGGEISGFIKLEIENGTIKGFELDSIDDIVKDGVDYAFADEVFAEVKLFSNKDINKENIEYKDISLMGDRELLLKTVEELYSFHTGAKIDMTFSVNLNSLERFLENSSIEYKQIEFSEDNILNNINLLIGSDYSVKQRNEIILNLFALVFRDQLNNLSSSLPAEVDTLGDTITSGDVTTVSSNINFGNLLQSLKKSDSSIKDSIFFGANYDKNDEIIENYGIADIELFVHLNNDFTTQKSLTIDISGVDSFRNSFVCTPNGSQNMEYSNIDQLFVTTTFSLDNTCSIFQMNDDFKYTISFDTLSYVNERDNKYSFQLRNEVGVNANYYVEFTFDNSLTLTPENDNFTKSGNKYFFSGYFEEEFVEFIFNIEE